LIGQWTWVIPQVELDSTRAYSGVEPVFFLIIDSHFTPGTGRIKSGTSKSPAIPVRKKGPKNYLNTKNNRITNNPKKTYHCQDSSLSKDVPGFCKVISCTKLAY
jgi:hypothetical protein